MMSKKNFRNPFTKPLADRPSDSTVIGLQEENRQLKRAVEELSILNDLSRAIGSSMDSQDIIRKIVDRSMRAVRAEQTVVTLVDRNANQPMRTLVRAMTSSAEHPHYHLNENLIGWMHLNKTPLLTNDPPGDKRFKGLKWDQTINSIVCVPLIVKSELIGVVTSYNKKDGAGFKEEDQRLLAIIAGQSAQIIENARLYEEEKALASMKEQIRLAAQIQLDLLPKSPPEIPGYDIAATSIPAQMVGGDYYDFLWVTPTSCAICLGDVSGKGLPASLLMATLQATLRGQAMLGAPTEETVRRSNRLMFESTDPEKFATLFFGVLDTESHKLAFCNAGHETPMIFGGNGDPVPMETGGMALGVLEDFPYERDQVMLDPGQTLIIYSDGIPDAINQSESPFGIERLLDLVGSCHEVSAHELTKRILEAVHEHEGETPQVDDLTLIVVKRTA